MLMNNTSELAGLKSISCAGYNGRNLVSKVEDIRILLQRRKLDILCIQETFLNDAIPSGELFVPDYNMFRHDRDPTVCKQSGGGLLVYTHKRCEVELVPGGSISTTDLELIWLKLGLNETRPTYICNMYRPPNGNVERAINMLDEKINDLVDGNTPDILLLGDVNIDLLTKNANNTKYSVSS